MTTARRGQKAAKQHFAQVEGSGTANLTSV